MMNICLLPPMRRSWRSFLLLALVLPSGAIRLSAQDAGEKLGAFGFVNGVDAEAPTFLEVNGSPYRVKGYQPGQLTMSGMLREGPTVFSVSNEGIGRAEVNQEVLKEQPFNFFAYRVQKKKETGETVDEIQLIKSPSRPSKDFKWSGLYLSGATNPATIYLGGRPVSLPPMKVVSLPLRGALEAGLKAEGEPMLRATPDEPAHYMLIVYDKKDGSLGLTLFPDAPQTE
jgi:hypothetical protein